MGTMGSKSEHLATLPVFCGMHRLIIYALNKALYYYQNASINALHILVRQAARLSNEHSGIGNSITVSF